MLSRTPREVRPGGRRRRLRVVEDGDVPPGLEIPDRARSGRSRPSRPILGLRGMPRRRWARDVRRRREGPRRRPRPRRAPFRPRTSRTRAPRRAATHRPPASALREEEDWGRATRDRGGARRFVQSHVESFPPPIGEHAARRQQPRGRERLAVLHRPEQAPRRRVEQARVAVRRRREDGFPVGAERRGHDPVAVAPENRKVRPVGGVPDVEAVASSEVTKTCRRATSRLRAAVRAPSASAPRATSRRRRRSRSGPTR